MNKGKYFISQEIVFLDINNVISNWHTVLFMGIHILLYFTGTPFLWVLEFVDFNFLHYIYVQLFHILWWF
jgi:hypothetical protein